ncbi:MAG TPA: PqqD family protein [Blastocatellia bacterium]|nr:PqqD family protein [Blastocatellia bacterium]
MDYAANNSHYALARREQLVVQEMPDEVLVYDLKTHKAHCLNKTAAFVWNHCDGKTAVAEIAEMMEQEWDKPVGEDIVWLAVRQLGKANLLQESVVSSREMMRFSRREVMHRLSLTALIALPLVTSVIVPFAAEAATCVIETDCAAHPCAPCHVTGSDPCTKFCKNGGLAQCVGSLSAANCP